MRSLSEIQELLDELETSSANQLEDQDLDFKEWSFQSMADSVTLVVEMAVCMANGGGGTVVFGVKNNVIGRDQAIIGVPPEVDANRLKKAVYDSTDPKLTPVFQELSVPEGSGRVLVVQIHPGLPPYTDTAGRGKIRVGRDCQPLTGTMRRRIAIETGESDFTAEEVPGEPTTHLSPSALEQLRDSANRERAPEELLRLSDLDLLSGLKVLRNGRLTHAGLFLAGKEASIRDHVPGYVWTHLRMASDTQYTDRMDGSEALPVALQRLTDRIMADNPIATMEYGMFHFEYRTYPEIALREALMNAFCHADFRIASPILVKQYPDRIEISNPGGFIGGISADNILHHEPVTRNPRLVDALARLRLVNRSNLGVGRMFEALLIEGKEPPLIQEQGEAIRIVFVKRDLDPAFRAFAAAESRQGRLLSVDYLLILQYLRLHAEIDTATGARICQRQEAEVREILSTMERERGYLERGGTGRGTYWTLRTSLDKRIAAGRYGERDRRIDWEAAKTRVLSVLKHRAEHGQPGLSNAEIRQITRFDRNQVFRMMRELQGENPKVSLSGKGRYAKYEYAD